QLLFSRPVNAMANMTSVGRKLLDIAKFGVKSGSSAHRELILDMMGYGLNNNYPFVGLDPKVPVVNLYGGADTIAPKNSIIEQAKMIHEQGGRVWVLEVETAGHLDVVFPRHLDAYMPYVLLALKNPYLLGEKGSHIKVEADHHYMPHLDCKSILSY
ncbi:MAG: hypothetical protein KDD38_06145, partial [Bdellovibrionales bacterium]|nr:hypothetical protein [Bdellovibrionales bacterium]